MELLIIRHALPIRRELDSGAADPEVSDPASVTRFPPQPIFAAVITRSSALTLVEPHASSRAPDPVEESQPPRGSGHQARSAQMQ